MRQHRRWAASASLAVGLTLGQALAACAAHARPPPGPAPPGTAPAHWARFRHAAGVVDLAGPRASGLFTVAAAGHLLTLTRAGVLRPFARGPGGYATAPGPEPYLALASGARVPGTGCAFGSGTVFALQPGTGPGIIAISAGGQAHRFANLPAGLSPTGIAFDATGRFGHRLLVTASRRGVTSVLAVDCAGRVATITAGAPAMEGGIAVAPASFGRYAGDLIAPSETTGRVFAVGPGGAVGTLAVSGLAHGGDIGVESAGFVPPGFGAGDAAYLADRFSRGNRHPGTDSILRLPGAELIREGVRAGDLLVATEAGARTIAVRCAGVCTVRYVAAGPGISHAEGHIAFTGPG